MLTMTFSYRKEQELKSNLKYFLSLQKLLSLKLRLREKNDIIFKSDSDMMVYFILKTFIVHQTFHIIV